ncbi:MAG: multicopper oxidase domain-containing protein [Chloroflexi bacterium]|nr:multicopper oxidase domain-containing protein [Chloroflexota bacterium]
MKLSTVVRTLLLGLVVVLVLSLGTASTQAAPPTPPKKKLASVTQADREAAAKRAAAKGLRPGASGKAVPAKGTSSGKPTGPVTGVVPPAQLDQGGIPHYFGPYANYANSPLPKGPITTLTLDFGGTGYTAPVVTIADVYGTGSGATAVATVTGGVITGLKLTNPGSGYSAPIVFIDDPAGVDAAATATIGGLNQVIGNLLIERPVPTDNAANVLVVNTHAPLTTGQLTAFYVFTQPGSGPNSFNAYVLRPTGVANEYTVVFDSGSLSVPSVATGTVTKFAVGPIGVLAGDLIAHYGRGIPIDIPATPGGTGADTTLYPADTAPAANQTVTLGTTWPIFSTDRTYSIGAEIVTLTGGIRKFVDSLPGVGAANANNLGQYIPVGAPDLCTFSGVEADCYEIELREYSEKMHSDLPVTKLRGYVQVKNGVDVTPIHYLGPTIVATKDRAVRITFRNKLPIGAGGNLFLPVDTTVMGSGMTPAMGAMAEMDPTSPMCSENPKPADCFKENRATLHLHGGLVPWISDGTTQQWTTPAGETTGYPKGVAVANVPDMPAAGPGELTFYYNNQQSARLMFYHDHSWGITRLNVYAGEAAGYILTDQVEQDMINGTNLSGVNPGLAKVLPDIGIPLIIQDKTFVDATTIAAQDPTWNSGTGPTDINGRRQPKTGDLWYPHVYMPNQNPGDLSGMNAFGRWHYGPWFWPPTNGIAYGPVNNPYYDCGAGQACTRPWESPQMPGTPKLSMAVEAFMDTPVVNGTAYPYLQVDPKAYRFRILNAADDRFWNLQLYVADSTVTSADGRTNTEVKLVPSPASVAGYPANYKVADPTTAGPSFIQIASEGGFLPAPVVLTNKPIGWNGDQTNFDVGIVNQGTLILGPAERADVIVDFSAFAGKTLILYNDSPAPFPALDVRYDYYTGKDDHTDTGGTPLTQPGFGPNTRTVMQIQVSGIAPAPAYSTATLNSVFAKSAGKSGVFEASQEPIIIPNTRYNSAYNKTFASEVATKVGIGDKSKTFQTISGATLTIPFQEKAIHDEASEVFDDYGRMSSMLGLVVPTQRGFAPYPFVSPPVDLVKFSMTPMTEPAPGDGTQIWKITHNGVDTHPIHFHLFSVQLINRVAWDNATRLPDPNELGWKETVRINPLQDTIVALRPVAPTQPFKLPNSERVIDPSMPTNAQLKGPLPNGFQNLQGNPVTVFNNILNFGWEYTYHCHILGHEEMDMMHVVSAVMAPDAPLNLVATPTSNSVKLSWTDNSTDETSFRIEKASADTGPWTALGTTVSPARGTISNTVVFTDTAVQSNTAYFYRVFALNVVGSTQASNFTQPAATGFPLMTAESAASNTATATVLSIVAAPTNLQAQLLGNPLRIRLSWMDNATNETGFRVERSVNGGAFVEIAAPGRRTGTGTATYTNSGITAGNTYAYRVRAANGGMFSNYSNTVTVIVALPAAPSGLTATAVPAGTRANVTLNWTDNANNEASFTIQRSTNATFTQNLVTVNNIPANSTTYAQNGVLRNRTFYYRIRAVNVVGVSAWSNVFTVVTP